MKRICGSTLKILDVELNIIDKEEFTVMQCLKCSLWKRNTWQWILSSSDMTMTKKSNRTRM